MGRKKSQSGRKNNIIGAVALGAALLSPSVSGAQAGQNHPPTCEDPTSVRVTKGREVSVDLDTFCSDPDGDNLSYSIVNFAQVSSASHFEVKDNKLVFNSSGLNPNKVYTAAFRAADTHGKSSNAEGISFIVRPSHPELGERPDRSNPVPLVNPGNDDPYGPEPAPSHTTIVPQTPATPTYVAPPCTLDKKIRAAENAYVKELSRHANRAKRQGIIDRWNGRVFHETANMFAFKYTPDVTKLRHDFKGRNPRANQGWQIPKVREAQQGRVLEIDGTRYVEYMQMGKYARPYGVTAPGSRLNDNHVDSDYEDIANWLMLTDDEMKDLMIRNVSILNGHTVNRSQITVDRDGQCFTSGITDAYLEPNLCRIVCHDPVFRPGHVCIQPQYPVLVPEEMVLRANYRRHLASGVRPGQQVPPAQALPECNDGRDNDNDGNVDYPNDKGCSSLLDNTELPYDNKPTIPPGKVPPVVPGAIPGQPGPETPPVVPGAIPGQPGPETPPVVPGAVPPGKQPGNMPGQPGPETPPVQPEPQGNRSGDKKGQEESYKYNFEYAPGMFVSRLANPALVNGHTVVVGYDNQFIWPSGFTFGFKIGSNFGAIDTGENQTLDDSVTAVGMYSADHPANPSPLALYQRQANNVLTLDEDMQTTIAQIMLGYAWSSQGGHRFGLGGELGVAIMSDRHTEGGYTGRNQFSVGSPDNWQTVAPSDCAAFAQANGIGQLTCPGEYNIDESSTHHTVSIMLAPNLSYQIPGPFRLNVTPIGLMLNMNPKEGISVPGWYMGAGLSFPIETGDDE